MRNQTLAEVWGARRKGRGAGDSGLGSQPRGGGYLVTEEEMKVGPGQAAARMDSQGCVGVVRVRWNRESSELNVH